MSSNYDWLSLMEISGPFLAVPVLKEVFPQGLEGLDGQKGTRLHRAYDEWRDGVDTDDPEIRDLHLAWIDEVLMTALEMDSRSIRRDVASIGSLRASLPEQGSSIAPDIVIVDATHGDAPLLPIHVYEPECDLESPRRFDGLVATPFERMTTMLRATGISLGLATNGERWTLIYAPEGKVATFATWYARLWSQEPDTLRAFTSLLGIRRIYGPEDERLPSLFDRSAKFQDEVTDALGEQVRRAVEVLVQSIDRADQDRNRELLRDVRERELYEAALTIMMRLVFLLAAEERGLLLLGDPLYEANYAVSTLRMQLRAATEEILERRRSAWSRLLALFRAVYGGVEHPSFRLPALGGSLFDPDRYPFLEGRPKGTSWRNCPAVPLPIDDRTVLMLLEAIQSFEGRTLSYRALDVEQIGHVYEGLLERTVKRVPDTTLELDAVASAKDPRASLGELESAALEGRGRIVELLKERSGRSDSAIGRSLDRRPEERLTGKLLTVCRGNAALRDLILPYLQLLRTDPWGYPLVHGAGSFVVVLGADRRETGTHYTPQSLTEKIVRETLTPLVYLGPAEGARPEEWKSKCSTELLDLKICDPAMGSGAFLVQVCRFLSERLVEAWALEEAKGCSIDAEGRIHGPGEAFDPLPRETEERATIARRLIAERCLYGVDLNPLAVELAKLSLWLVTLAKNRPFGFLDHNLRSGDSLLGVSDRRWWESLSLGSLFASELEDAVREATDLRVKLREIPIRDIKDIETMAALDKQARSRLAVAEALADAVCGALIASESKIALKSRFAAIGLNANRISGSDVHILESIADMASSDLAKDAPDCKPRRPFHWYLEFPEVFLRENIGFDAMIGNPPFMGGRLIGRRLGMSYQEYLRIIRNNVVGSPDLCTYFFLRAFCLIKPKGYFGLLATKSIAETGSRDVCLDQIIEKDGVIYQAYSRFPWPGKANVAVSIVWVNRNGWEGAITLDGKSVSSIDGALEENIQLVRPKKLKYWKGKYSQGQDLMGRGFELTAEERDALISEDPNSVDVIFPYYNGQDLNTIPSLDPYRWVVYFRDWPKERAMAYKPAYARLEHLVKPYRESLTGQIHQDCFWKFWDLRPRLMDEAAKQNSWFALPRVTKYITFLLVPSTNVYNEKTKLFFFNQWPMFAVLQSSLHQHWAWWTSGTLGLSTLNYSTSKSLETWPMPDLHLSSNLKELGQNYYTIRSDFLISADIGPTDFYNRFHDPEDNDSRVTNIRGLHRAIDVAVARAYDWTDLDLDHGFHEVPYLPPNDRVRYTISEKARIEVLRRLTTLNLQQHEAESSGSAPVAELKSRKSRKQNDDASNEEKHPTLGFEPPMEASPEKEGSEPSVMILEYLRATSVWQSKAEIVDALKLSDSQWNTAIPGLIIGGAVERNGERRGTRYRIKDLKTKSNGGPL